MRKMYYIIVVFLSLLLISCQENEVIDNDVLDQLQAEVSLSFALDKTEDNIVLGSSDQNNINQQERVSNNNLLVLIECKNTNSNKESFAFFSYTPQVVVSSSSTIDMQMFYGENKVTLKCFDMYSLSEDLSSILDIPRSIKGETYTEYSARVLGNIHWDLDLATNRYQTAEGKIAFRTSNFEFFGASTIDVKSEAEIIDNITLFRLTSKLQLDLRYLAQNCPDSYQWNFLLSLNKESIDLYNESFNNSYNIDKIYVDSYLKHLQMPEPSVLDEQLLISVTHNCIKIEARDLSRGYFNDFLTEMDISRSIGIVESSKVEQNSYGVAALSYSLLRSDEILAEGKIRVNSDIYSRDYLLPILRLHTNHKLVIKASSDIYTDDYLYDTHLIFEELDYKETIIIISDNGAFVVV